MSECHSTSLFSYVLLLFLFGAVTAKPHCTLYEHVDANRHQPGASYTLEQTGQYRFEGHSFDNRLSSVAISEGKLVMYDNHRTYLNVCTPRPGYGFDVVNLQPEQDNRVSLVDWIPESRRHRSLLSDRPVGASSKKTSGVTGCPQVDLVLGNSSAATTRKLQAWGEHSARSILILYENKGSYDDFNRGRTVTANSCFEGDLDGYEFDKITSSLVICGGRIRGHSCSGGGAEMFEIQARVGECLDVQFDGRTEDVLSNIQYNECGCDLEC